MTRLKFSQLIRAAKRRGSTIIISSHTMEGTFQFHDVNPVYLRVSRLFHLFLECEHTADTICIMTAGKQFCEDTPQNLKAQHGKFYSVTVKVVDKTAGSTQSLNTVGVQQPITVGHQNGSQAPKSSAGAASDVADTRAAAPHSSGVMLIPPSGYQSVVLDERRFLNYFQEAQFNQSFSAGLYKHLFFKIPKQSVRLSQLFFQLDRWKKESIIAECVVNTASLEEIFMHIALEDEYKSAYSNVVDTA